MQGLAHLAVTEGGRSEVLPLLDEAAALAMRPGVAPIHAGYVYCAVISICRALCDWGRATEWTHMSTRYCERESIAGYTGLCRFHQGEIDRLHGYLAQAEERVLQACEELLAVNRYSAAWGYSELVEIRVRRGDLGGAEEALAQAVAFGGDGQPGRGRLLLAQGDARAAVRSLTRALAGQGFLDRERRIFVLPVHVSACLAVGDDQAAGESVAELEELARRLGTPGPAAAAAVARGELALHRGDTEGAIASLQEGVRTWCEVDAPYEAAQARVLLARALAAEGDDAGARLEVKAAARTVEEIGAAVDLDIAPPRLDQAALVRSAPSCSPTSWTRPGWPRPSVTTPGSSCCAGTTARCGPSSSGGAARRSSTVATGSSWSSASPTTASAAPPPSSGPWPAIAPSTASRPPCASGSTPARPPHATATTSARRSPGQPASPPRPEPARSW